MGLLQLLRDEIVSVTLNMDYAKDTKFLNIKFKDKSQCAFLMYWNSDTYKFENGKMEPLSDSTSIGEATSGRVYFNLLNQLDVYHQKQIVNQLFHEHVIPMRWR